MRLLDVYDGTGVRRGALNFLYLLLQAREPEHSISHRAMPTFEQHRAFVTKRPYRAWFLIETTLAQAPALVGHVYLTHQNEIGIFLTREAQGRGIGPWAIAAIMSRHRPTQAQHAAEGYRPFLANIAPANERSKRTFERLGFRKISETYAYFEEEHRGPETEKG